METKRTNLVLRLAALNEHENQQLGSSSNTFYNFNFNKQTTKMKLKDKIISLLMTTVVMLSTTLTAWGQWPLQYGDLVVVQQGLCNGGPLNMSAPALTTFDVQNWGSNVNTATWNPPSYSHPSWTRGNLGDIFGCCVDNWGNIYVTATVNYGLCDYIGPGGSGAVYKINGISGAISTFATLPQASPVPNSAPINTTAGLGNIAYDKVNNQFFVTNFEDGKIYKVSYGGIATPFLDPFTPDGGTAGPAPLGERLWGIEVYNNKVYFSRWVEDMGAFLSSTKNEIWSVPVTGGVATLELSVSDLGCTANPFSSPVSDISFSQSGKMLLAERGNNNFTSVANHYSRILEYELVLGVWTLSPAFGTNLFKFNPGTIAVCPSNFANSSGGCDYGYRRPSLKLRDSCDHSVWVSMDNFGGYFQGFPSSGGNITNSARHNMGTSKNQIGDVDVFRGECGGKPQQQPNCDSIHVELLPLQSRAGCCWQLTYSNPYPNAFTSLTTTIVSGGGSFGSVSAGSLNIGAVSPTSVTWVPFSGSFLPVGTFPTSTAGSFCLNLITAAAVPQVIVFTWSGPNGLICKDTMKLQCQPHIRHECVDLKEVKISCKGITPNGNVYNVSFMVFNNSAFPMDKLVISAPSGFTLTPGTPFIHYFSPPVPIAGSGTISFQISGTGAVNGANLCLNIKMSDTALSPVTKLEYDKNCCGIDTCFKLPECKDCCKDFRKIVGTSTITTNANGNVVNGLLIGAGPTPISKLTIQLVSSSIKVSCKKLLQGSPETSAGWQNANATLGPVLPNPITTGLPLYSQTGYEGVWGINTSGVPMLPPVVLSNFNVQFPPPPCNSHGTICWDSVKYCLKISFTDTMCVTCDTTICFTVRRAGRPWWSCYYLTAGGSIGSRKGIASPEDNKGSQLMSSSSEMSLSTLKMKDDKTGTLSVALPSAEETGGVVAVKQICTEAVFGSRLTRFDGIDARDFSACSNKAMKSGESRDIPLEIDNYSKQKMVGLVVRMFFTQEGYTDVSVFEDTVYAVIPGKDQVQPASLGEGQAPVKSAKTYSLYFAGNPKDEVNIDRIVVRTPKDATILAVGPFRDKNSVSMQLNEDSSWTDGKVGMRFFPEKPATDPTNLVALKNRIEPTFITISSEQKEITIECDSYDNNGTFIGTSTVVLRSPLSNVETGKDKDAANKAVLYPIYPNPTMNSISIQFALPSGGDKISLEMYDAEGKELPAIFSNQAVSAGEQVVVYNANNLPNGKYFVRLVSSKGTSIQSFTVVR